MHAVYAPEWLLLVLAVFPSCLPRVTAGLVIKTPMRLLKHASPTMASTRESLCQCFLLLVPSESPWTLMKQTDISPDSVTAVGATRNIPEVVANLSGGGFSNYVSYSVFKRPGRSIADSFIALTINKMQYQSIWS